MIDRLSQIQFDPVRLLYAPLYALEEHLLLNLKQVQAIQQLFLDHVDVSALLIGLNIPHQEYHINDNSYDHMPMSFRYYLKSSPVRNLNSMLMSSCLRPTLLRKHHLLDQRLEYKEHVRQ